MLQNTHLSALGKLIGQLASNRDPSWFYWVLKLTMTTSLSHLKPAIILNQYEDIGYFHLIVLSEILDVQCRVRVQAVPGAGLKGRGGL